MRPHAKTERNGEIVRRALAGESGVSLAQAFGVSTSRVGQIIAAARGKLASQSERAEPAPRGEPAAFTGEVQVLPGTAAGARPLKFSPQMRHYMERARAAQQPMRTLGGMSERVA